MMKTVKGAGLRAGVDLDNSAALLDQMGSRMEKSMTAAAPPQAGTPDIDPFKIARWDLVPGRTALVVIDPQNDFLHADGWYAKSGVDITHMQRTIEPTRALVAAARAKGIPVIWTRHGFRDGRDAGVFYELRPFLKDGGLRQGTWGGAILDGLGAVPEDWYIEKTRLSAFYNTSLDTTLRAVKAETVLFAGVLILGVLAQISQLLRIFEISCDFLASLRAKRLKLFSELLDLFFT